MITPREWLRRACRRLKLQRPALRAQSLDQLLADRLQGQILRAFAATLQREHEARTANRNAS